ncbi:MULTISPECIES: fructose-1,6-bisphosphatase [unclassified Clostridioides]|uniref:fructose-1,6-bisphosphatase n=1 Tax=unclassified Clostridioides TaxID=2635829 RepID=UPI001D0C81C1|nr:fructose-1,6-bisphosphatase [Clostridioides sp. ES-S-0001-02]MCC0640530.1 fructose-1,6-bisphosphatase [Clostridioides sp. ES-S-0049-03]MCC0651681.1 fructose-1,6-bisphosphatase [Clostridioides sp. ES-S-0001-03]MCC0676801.1 fructose-1,6-bisphosphatase [Clostridioides sp. ES-W-0018-02]MCC0678765.1 fructose-1,6-bisphosphatase [Clostridioides sp. ES-S-0005-03]MCC0694070.1 fructose-1,6-bisphosphatase [Clostridioides sp. ES-S-0048-02]MCC0703243.1 fructose-1,6-bisphosphatase [Clostridioides sp. ES
MKNLCKISDEYLNSKLKYLKLLSKQYPSISKASTEIINLEAILNLPKGTEHFITDVHGEYEPFVHVLKNGSGVIKRKIEELFSNTIRDSEKKMLATLVYYPEQKLDLIIKQEENIDDFYRINIYRLIELCKYASSKYTRSKVRKLLPENFKYIIEELLHEHIKSEHKEEYYKSIVETIVDIGIAKEFIIAISTVIQKLVVDRLHVIGDIYDRGPRPDIIVDKLIEHHCVDIQWGNHDILWMGAASGEKTCIANALRISARYANLDIVEDIYGINLLPLATFAIEMYKDDPCKEFIPKINDQSVTTTEKSLMAKMHKAISIIQFKLEGEVIKRRPEFEMEHRLLLNMINYEEGTITLKGKTYKLKDTYLPTIDKKDPYKLSIEEKNVIEKLVSSFRGSEKLQKHVSFLFSKGSIYLKANSNLLIHGCVPLNEDGSFMSMNIMGKEYKGKILMDKMESLAREGFFFKDKAEEKLYGMDIMWYLWTGKCSSLFGKDDMTTFERYFIAEKETHKENKNPYFKLRESDVACERIFEEFDLELDESHIINGHVPVESKNGESPIKANGKILVIDGGFSRAYQKTTGIAGYTLIYNSRTLQLVSHEPFNSAEEAIANESDILSTTVVVEHKAKRKMVRDTDEGVKIQEEIEDLKLLLMAYKKGLIKEM